MGNAVHRLVEQHAAARPETMALLDGSRSISYRELNQRANTLARRLRETGLTRGSLAMVRMPRSVDVAVVLLAILKAGACYTWIGEGASGEVAVPEGVCILHGRSAQEEQFLAVDLRSALAECVWRLGPNLPVLTRSSDVACVLPDTAGRPHVLVPHATIAALPPPPPGTRAWEGVAGALDLWLGLMSGATLSLDAASHATAAA